MLRHESYKPSGIPWVGDIPSHWCVKKNKFLLSERKAVVGKDAPKFKLLSLTLQGVILRDMENPKGKFPAEFDTYKQVSPDDLIFCLFDVEETPRTVGLAKHHGMITGAYTVTRCNEQVSSAFLYYYYLSLDEGKQLRSLYTGLRNVITRDAFFGLATPFPPHEEQDRIVAFLDQKTAEIDKTIAKKERLIELIEEQKTTLINELVTKGQDPCSLEKPSNVKWLGNIPNRWKVKPLKRWAQINTRTLSENTDPSLEFRYVDIGSVGSGCLVKELEQINFEMAPSRARRILRQGDTIISLVRTYLKAIWYVSSNVNDLVASTGFAVLTPMDGVEPEYLSYALQSAAFVSQVSANSVGIAYPAITETVLGRLCLAMPPSLEEQKAIVRLIKKFEEKSDAIREKLHHEISALKKLKSSVIAEAVTGKFKV